MSAGAAAARSERAAIACASPCLTPVEIDTDDDEEDDDDDDDDDDADGGRDEEMEEAGSFEVVVDTPVTATPCCIALSRLQKASASISAAPNTTP